MNEGVIDVVCSFLFSFLHLSHNFLVSVWAHWSELWFSIMITETFMDHRGNEPRVRLHGWHSSIRTTRHPAMRPKYTSQKDNFWIFTIESFATRTLMLLILCLEDDLAAWKLSAKPPHIFVSLHCIRDTLFTHSSHFSPSTGGTCCERWNTMLLELYPRVGYVSPHTVKDGWTWLHPPQHLELLCEVLCVCVCVAIKWQKQKLLNTGHQLVTYYVSLIIMLCGVTVKTY